MVDSYGLIDLQTISMVSAAIGILMGILNWINKSGVAEKQTDRDRDEAGTVVHASDGQVYV